MINTMTVTKTLAGLLGALLVLLLLQWAAREIYTLEPAVGDKQAFIIDTGSEDESAPGEETSGAAASGGATSEDVKAAFEAAYANADVAKGEKIFGKCKACHKVDGTNSTGPHLNGVVDRAIASLGDFKYSAALIDHAGAHWDPATLSEFLTSPKTFAPGTKMAFAGLKTAEERADVIAYLATLK